MKSNLTRPEDFLMDDSFIEYCTGSKRELNIEWDKWIESNPDKQEAIQKAKRMLARMNGHSGDIEMELSRFKSLLGKQTETTTVQDISPITSAPQLSFFKKWRAVAAVLFVLLAGATVILSLPRSKKTIAAEGPVVQVKQSDVLPGGIKATLTMSNGKSLDLDSLNAETLHETNGALINKGKGILVYNDAKISSEDITYNTLSTPNGGEYQLLLPDGSKVWLNAASSIRFPTKFAATERTVYLTGEAYFEVAKNPKQPFHVQMNNGLQVEVLGTQFNVMGYDDEAAIKTTLVEGKVLIKQSQKIIELKPSQQGLFRRAGEQLSVTEADVDKEIGWRLGYFEFEDEDLPTIMRQLARWYDLDVVFGKNIPEKHYSGSISRKLTLVQVLQILKLAGVQYSIENKKITISRL